jgi:hypothetical protein
MRYTSLFLILTSLFLTLAALAVLSLREDYLMFGNLVQQGMVVFVPNMVIALYNLWVYVTPDHPWSQLPRINFVMVTSFFYLLAEAGLLYLVYAYAPQACALAGCGS